MLLMAYYHPWTLIDVAHSTRATFLGALKQEHNTFLDAQSAWRQRGIVCEESQMFIRNFINKTRTRASSGDDDKGEQSDDLLSDEELIVSSGRLSEAVLINVGGRGARDVHGSKQHWSFSP